jgi:hypothetical protein
VAAETGLLPGTFTRNFYSVLICMLPNRRFHPQKDTTPE